MTHEELKNKLDELLALPKETEWVEFKTAGLNFFEDKIGKYNSALSNEANLREKDYGWLVLGVNDNRQIVGSNYHIENLSDLKYKIYQNTIIG